MSLRRRIEAVSRMVLTVAVTLLLFTGATAFAQEEAGAPDISIGPDGGTYTISASNAAEAGWAGGQVVEVAVIFADFDGVNKNTLNATLSSPGSTVVLTRTSWTSNDPMLARAKYQFKMVEQGNYVLTVCIADNTGLIATRQATFRLNYTDPAVPIVTLDPHHDEFRDTTLGAATLDYTMPAYTSLGVARSFGLRYDSEQSDPTAFVELDADMNMYQRAQYNGGAFSLKVFDAATNAQVTPELMWKFYGGGRQRLAAHWSMRGRATGAYMYWAEVRAYRSDGTSPSAATRVPVRILVVNHVSSRYGSGWSLAGVQRIHSVEPTTDSGFLLEEGNGIARWFAKESCGYSQCTYRTPRGDFSKIVYNVSANQWVRTYPDGSTATFSGRGQGLLLNVSDRLGRTVRYVWQFSTDGQNVPLLAQVIDPAGKVTALSYHASAYLKDIVEPGGRSAYFHYTGADLTTIYGPTSAANLLPAYDADHKLKSFTNARGTWDIAYDDFRQVKFLTAPAITVAGNAGVRPVTELASLPAALVPPATACGPATPACWTAATPANQVVMTITDPAGHKTQVAFDRYGNPTKVVDAAGTTVTTIRTADGLPWQTISPLQTSTISWGANGQQLSEEVNGTVVFNGSLTGDHYDYMNSMGEARWYTYGDRGQLLKTWLGKREDSTRLATTYTYDASYRLIIVVGPKGERTEWSYDPVWQNVSEVRWLGADGTWRKETFAYDSAGRLQSKTNALGETSTMSYDALNRSVRTVDLDRVLSFTYTGADLTSVTVPGGNVYGFRYNALGWLESEIFPDGTSRSATYTIDGLVASRTDRRARKVTMSYDAAHRLTSRLADGQTTSKSSVTITYPPVYIPGAQVVLTNGEVQESYGYGDSGSIVSTKYALGSRSYVMDRVLDGYNAWQQSGVDIHKYSGTTHQGTDYIRYTSEYDAADPAMISAYHIDTFENYDTKRTTLSFDNSGRHVKTVFANGVTQANAYNSEGLRVGTTFSPAAGLDANYEYDALGRLKSRGAPGRSTHVYHYDRYGRVQYFQKVNWHATLGWVFANDEQFIYDLAGNRTNRGGTLQPNSNKYQTFDGYTLEYDAERNLTRKYKAGFDQRLEWNALGQLVTVTTNGAIVTYGYTPSGLRFRRTQGGTPRYYVYFDGNLLLEIDQDGNTVRRYAHMPGTDNPLSVKETIGGTDTVRYFALDHPGNVLGLMSSTGAVTATYDYRPFGAEAAANDGQPLRFMGRELDSGTGLYYVRNRWYDPALERFISEDPIGLAGGLNTYSYVGNDPMNARDPSGLQAQAPATLPPVVVCTKRFSWGWDDCSATEPPADMFYFPLNNFRPLPEAFRERPCSPAMCPDRYPKRPSYAGPTIGPNNSPRKLFPERNERCDFFRNWGGVWSVVELAGGGSSVPMRGYAPLVTYQRQPGVAGAGRTLSTMTPRFPGTLSIASNEWWAMYEELGCRQ